MTNEKAAPIERPNTAEAAAKLLGERLVAILDWCDLALANKGEFDSHGVRNLTGPVFDAARAALDSCGPRFDPRVDWIDTKYGPLPVPAAPKTPAKSPAMSADYTANHLQGLVEPD